MQEAKNKQQANANCLWSTTKQRTKTIFVKRTATSVVEPIVDLLATLRLALRVQATLSKAWANGIHAHILYSMRKQHACIHIYMYMWLCPMCIYTYYFKAECTCVYTHASTEAQQGHAYLHVDVHMYIDTHLQAAICEIDLLAFAALCMSCFPNNIYKNCFVKAWGFTTCVKRYNRQLHEPSNTKSHS